MLYHCQHYNHFGSLTPHRFTLLASTPMGHSCKINSVASWHSSSYLGFSSWNYRDLQVGVRHRGASVLKRFTFFSSCLSILIQFFLNRLVECIRMKHFNVWTVTIKRSLFGHSHRFFSLLSGSYTV